MPTQQQRRGSPRPGNGGQRAGAGRPPLNVKLSPGAARQLHHLARIQERPAPAILAELIDAAYNAQEAAIDQAAEIAAAGGR